MYKLAVNQVVQGSSPRKCIKTLEIDMHPESQTLSEVHINRWLFLSNLAELVA